jgi:hypothetical protein
MYGTNFVVAVVLDCASPAAAPSAAATPAASAPATFAASPAAFAFSVGQREPQNVDSSTCSQGYTCLE